MAIAGSAGMFPEAVTDNATTKKETMKVLIVYYSLYGHTYQLARAVEKGVASVNGAEPVLRRVQEFDSVLKETSGSEHANALREETKKISVCTVDDLREADAVLFGSPTRYGNMTAQMKQLIDSTAGLWLKGEMEGKPAGVFTSTASTHGGQETTLITMMIPLLHLGMIIVGLPYSHEGMIHTEGRGSSPYGASVLAGARGELQPKPEDLKLGEALGKRVAEVALKVRAK
jgi:NAD(P)H dehydrogenase (quinone)